MKITRLEKLIEEFRKTGGLPINARDKLLCVSTDKRYNWHGLKLVRSIKMDELQQITERSKRFNDDLSSKLTRTKYIMPGHSINLETGQVEHHMYSLRRDEQNGKWFRQDIVEQRKVFISSQSQDNKIWMETQAQLEIYVTEHTTDTIDPASKASKVSASQFFEAIGEPIEMVKKGTRYTKPNYGREVKQKRTKTMVAKQAL